jgi:hypothetical protein
MKLRRKILATIAATLTTTPLLAGEWDITGFAGLDTRAFWTDARFEDQSDDLNVSLMIQPEIYWRSDDDRQRVSIVGFARADSHDSQRTHADLREAYWGLEGKSWDMNIGINKIFWGVAESRHLVDVINQTDLVEDIDGEDKLGQPMLNLNLQRDYGRFGVFVMPYFRERTFAGADGRLRSPWPVDTDRPIYESSDEEQHVDFALRYSHYIGDMDIGVHVFEGTSREPRFVLAPDTEQLLPVYEQMTQIGMDLQYTQEEWLWKLEAIGRDANSGSFLAAVGGVEYSFYGVRDSAADIGIILEYQFDGRDEGAPPTIADNDIFVGARFALNDASDTSVLAGFAADLDSRATFFNVEAERRFGDNLSVEMRLRAFMNAEPDDPLFAFEHDNYLQLRLNWYY